MRLATVIPFALAAVAVTSLPLSGVSTASAAGPRSDVLPLSDVKPGMKGYGLTVFEGTEPERFDVEVIDVLENFRPGLPIIIVKTAHPRLEVVKVVAGMSGSPIYLNDKMIGAYSYGFGAPVEAVAGVTPIDPMLEDLDRPVPAEVFGFPLAPRHAARAPRPADGRRFTGPLLGYDAVEHVRQVVSDAPALAAPGVPGGVRPVATPLAMAGLSAGAERFGAEWLGGLGLEPVAAAGTGASSGAAPTRYVDGGPVGIQLIRGDASAMGLGTVTRVEGDRLVAFGHPMLQGGASALPAALSRVAWTYGSIVQSYKIGAPVRPHGALVMDRIASIVVDTKIDAPVIAVDLGIAGSLTASDRRWRFEIAHDPMMTPGFLMMAALTALETSAGDRAEMRWTMTSSYVVRGHGSFSFVDQGESWGGISPRAIGSSRLLRTIGALLNNPWEPVFIEELRVDFKFESGLASLELRGVELLDSELEPGQPARLRVTLERPGSGERVVRTVEVPIPKSAAGGSVELDIGTSDGVMKDHADPESLEDLLRIIRDLDYPSDRLLVAYGLGKGAAAFRGHVAHELPPGAVDALSVQSSSLAPVTFGTAERYFFPVPGVVRGGDSVTVTVLPAVR